MFLREWRYDHKRDPIARKREVTGRPNAGCTHIAGQQIERLDSIGTNGRLWRYMIVKAAEFVKRHNEGGVLPRGPVHDRINKSGNIVRTSLHTATRRHRIKVGRM